MARVGKRKKKLSQTQEDQVCRLYYEEKLPVKPFLIDIFKVKKNTIYRALNISAIQGSKRQQKVYDLRK